MITYAERTLFHKRHLDAFEFAQHAVGRLSSHWGNELRCHELARAVLQSMINRRRGLEWGLAVVDGKCGPVEHSWLQFDDGVALDVYAPGRKPSVQLVDNFIGGYARGEPRADIRASVVKQLVREMG